MFRYWRIAAFAFYLRQKSEQNKNYRETDEADADEGQVAQNFPPYHMILFDMTLKKGGNPLRTAPPILDSHKLINIIS